MGSRTPNIDRVGNEGATFTDCYGQQSCTAWRAAFITGQNPIRTGLTKVGIPGADVGLRAAGPTIAGHRIRRVGIHRYHRHAFDTAFLRGRCQAQLPRGQSSIDSYAMSRR
jgi:arylsulfatase A-like enzyme